MTYRKSGVLAILASACILAAIILSALVADDALARPVALTDARTPPTYLVYLYPRGSVTYARTEQGYNCPRSPSWFTDESAYTFHGRELSSQRWNRTHDLTYWTDRHGKHVTFDGITFVNHTNYPVLVAGWC